jgi:hypothetical protein
MVSMIICAEHVIFYAGFSVQYMQQNGIQETSIKGQKLRFNWLSELLSNFEQTINVRPSTFVPYFCTSHMRNYACCIITQVR